MENKLKQVASILARYQFEVIPLDDALSKPASLYGPGVFVIAQEHPGSRDEQTMFSILEPGEADRLYELLIDRRRHWQDQVGKVAVLIARIDDPKIRAKAVNEIKEFCKIDKPPAYPGVTKK